MNTNKKEKEMAIEEEGDHKEDKISGQLLLQYFKFHQFIRVFRAPSFTLKHTVVNS